MHGSRLLVNCLVLTVALLVFVVVTHVVAVLSRTEFFYSNSALLVVAQCFAE